MPGVIVESLWPAWHAVQQRDDIGRLIAAAHSGDYDERLDGAGLSGAELAFKRAGWSNARRAGRAAPTLGPLERWLKWIDVILGSLIAVIGAGEGLEELKEGFEAELEDLDDGTWNDAAPHGRALVPHEWSAQSPRDDLVARPQQADDGSGRKCQRPVPEVLL
jgi:hypothetical protein